MGIRKIFLMGLLCLFLINSVIALDCQYTENESYSVEEEWFYFDGDFEGVNLKMDELVHTENNRLSFIVYNNLTIPVKVQLNYTLRSDWFGINQPTAVEIEVGPRDSKSYQEERISSGGAWGNYYWIEKFIPTVISPEITSKYKTVEKQKEICKKCVNEICLNDGASCNTLYDDSRCGSGICNIASFCGHEKIVPCPSGLKNCNNKNCLTPSIRQTNESYSCGWECASGTIACDGICRTVSSKNVGQEYYCIEECKSGRGKEGVCLKSIEEWIYWIIGIFLVTILVTIIIIFIIKKGPFTKKIKELELKIKGLEEQSNKKEKEIVEIEKKGVNLKDIIKKNEELSEIKKNEINFLTDIINLKEEELKTVGDKVKIKVGDELKNLKNKLNEIKRTNQKLEEEIDKQERGLKRKEKLGIEERKIETARLLGISKDKLILDGEYFRYKQSLISNGKGEFAHITLYKRHINSKIPIGYQIHHIDGNDKNNNLWNLIAIKKELHFGLQGKIVNKGWEFGLNYLLDNQIVKEENLHDNIKTHRKELKEQKKLF